MVVKVYFLMKCFQTFLLLYADDIAQISDRIWYLQDQINTVQTFCTKSGIQVNVRNTQIIVFRNGVIVKENKRWFLNTQKNRGCFLLLVFGPVLLTKTGLMLLNVLVYNQVNHCI